MRLIFGGWLCALIAVASASCGLAAGLGDYTDKLGVAPDGALGPVETGGDADDPPDDATADTTPGDDVTTDAPGTGNEDAASEAGAIPNDSGYGVDAKPPCNSTYCATGCCTASGDCASGEQTTACGPAGGSACTDCSKNGQVCSSGACIAPMPEAGPPPACVATSCKSCGFLEKACCSSNQCGCEPAWGGSCQ